MMIVTSNRMECYGFFDGSCRRGCGYKTIAIEVSEKKNEVGDAGRQQDGPLAALLAVCFSFFVSSQKGLVESSLLGMFTMA